MNLKITENTRKQGLGPLAGPEPTILILGSLPGDESLRRKEYYGNPKNLFWKVLAAVFMDDVPEGYTSKKKFLATHHVALWDVLASAERDGSLDSHIKREERNDVAGFLQKHPSINTVVLNGGKAARAFRKTVQDCPEAFQGIQILEFTSTSPLSISAGWPLARIIEQWKSLLNV